MEWALPGTTRHKFGRDRAASSVVHYPRGRPGPVAGPSILRWDERLRQSEGAGDHETEPEKRRADGTSPWEPQRSRSRPVPWHDFLGRSSRFARVACGGEPCIWQPSLARGGCRVSGVHHEGEVRPQRGLAELIFWIRFWTSGGTDGRP